MATFILMSLSQFSAFVQKFLGSIGFPEILNSHMLYIFVAFYGLAYKQALLLGQY